MLWPTTGVNVVTVHMRLTHLDGVELFLRLDRTPDRGSKNQNE